MLIISILIFAAWFSSLVFFVVVVAALLAFGGLHFDLVLGLGAFFSLFVLSSRRDLNKNSSKPCSYLRHVLEKTRLK